MNHLTSISQRRFSAIVWILVASLMLASPFQSAQAVTYTANTSGDWNVAATWSGAGVPGLNDEINILTNVNVTVNSTPEQFGGPLATAVSFWENSGETLRVNGGNTLTHNDGPFAFEIRPQATGANIWRLRGGGTFVNNGTLLSRPRTNSYDTGRINDANTLIQNNGIWEFTDARTNGTFGHQSLLIEGNGIDIAVDSTGAGTGSAGGNFRINSPNGFVTSLGFREYETANTFTYTGDPGETPFDIVAGHFLLGLPGRGDSFTYNGTNFNGATGPLHTAFDRTVFDDLFGTAPGDIPAGSNVGVAGAFDTINLISANSGSTASPELHNFNGRIGIGDTGWWTIGNMMPTSDGGTLTITPATDADWYGGGFNTRGGTVSNNGTLTAPAGMTMWRAGTPGTLYIGDDIAGVGEFRNEVTGTVRLEEGTLQVRDDATFRNFGTFELAGNLATLTVADGAAGGFVHEVGGTFTVAPGAGNIARVAGDTGRKPFDNASGAPITVTNGTLRFYPGTFQVNGVTQSTITASTLTSNFTVGGTENLEFMPVASTMIDIDPGALPANMKPVIWGGLTPLVSTGMLEISEQSELEWALGHMTLSNGTIINRGTINKTGANGYQINSGNGQANAFQNYGELNLLAGSSNLYIYQSTTLENHGLVAILGDGGEQIRPVNGGNATYGGPAIDNRPDGTIRVRTAADSQTNYIRFLNAPSGSAPTHKLRNEGTLEVTRGIFRIYEGNVAWADFLSATDTELTEGTYRVISTGTDRSMLDLDILDPLDINGSNVSGTNDTYTGSVVSIASAAKLVLSSDEALGASSGAQFPQLGAINNLEGSLYVHGAVNLPVDPALNVENGATLGGSGTFSGSGGPLALTVDNGGTLDPSALDGTGGTLTIDGDLALNDTSTLSFGLGSPGIVGGPNDLVIVNGDLTLDGVLDIEALPGFANGMYRLFNYTGNLTDNDLVLPNSNFILDLSIDGQVNLTVVPEPSTMVLMLLGVVALVQRVRRRKRREV